MDEREAEFIAVAERVTAEHPDLAYWKESDRECVQALIVAGMRNGLPPQTVVDESIGLVREINRKPRPVSAEQASVDDEIARMNEARRVWGSAGTR
jgi:hypothetical protein